MFGLEDERKTTFGNLPLDVKEEAKYILEETGDATNAFLVKKAPEAVSGVHGQIKFTILTPLEVGDVISVGGHTVSGYNGVDSGNPYNIDVTANNTASLQATAIRALTFEGFTTSGVGSEIILTRVDYDNESIQLPSPSVGVESKLGSVSVVSSESPVADITGTFTNSPFRFSEEHKDTVVVWFNGGYERVNSDFGSF